MSNLSEFYRAIEAGEDLATLKGRACARTDWGVYPDSLHVAAGTLLFMARNKAKKVLVAVEEGPIYQELEGEATTGSALKVKVCPLSVANSQVIRRYFPFTNPVALANCKTTIGLGDRLGLASGGHLRLLKQYPSVRPVLAQQSMRELTLTNRDYGQVLADAVWAVFQEDYQLGFGADGDHLKTAADIKMALDFGYTMITLDCSDHITNLAPDRTAEVEERYAALPSTERVRLEQTFLGKTFALKTGISLSFTAEALKYNVAVYQEAIAFAIKIYQELLKPLDGKVDFEVSIDETMTPTAPLSHFFVAAQLVAAGVKVSSMAPRFCGEFQKGINYRGDLKQFSAEYRDHTKIADHFGYKLSIHSGSDKFDVFPVIGRESKGHVHVKTAGTNWLEAIKVIIAAEPALYREIHGFALQHLAEARQYYHISADPERVPALADLSDDQLPALMEADDARQIIHITYGLILMTKEASGGYLFRDRIYACLLQNEELYYRFLGEHIGKHLTTLDLS
mgnify:FL=1